MQIVVADVVPDQMETTKMVSIVRPTLRVELVRPNASAGPCPGCTFSLLPSAVSFFMSMVRDRNSFARVPSLPQPMMKMNRHVHLRPRLPLVPLAAAQHFKPLSEFSSVQDSATPSLVPSRPSSMQSTCLRDQLNSMGRMRKWIMMSLRIIIEFWSHSPRMRP